MKIQWLTLFTAWIEIDNMIKEMKIKVVLAFVWFNHDDSTW